MTARTREREPSAVRESMFACAAPCTMCASNHHAYMRAMRAAPAASAAQPPALTSRLLAEALLVARARERRDARGRRGLGGKLQQAVAALVADLASAAGAVAVLRAALEERLLGARVGGRRGGGGPGRRRCARRRRGARRRPVGAIAGLAGVLTQGGSFCPVCLSKMAFACSMVRGPCTFFRQGPYVMVSASRTSCELFTSRNRVFCA